MVAQHCYNGDGSGDVTFLWEKGEFETLKQIVSLSHLIMWTRWTSNQDLLFAPCVTKLISKTRQQFWNSCTAYEPEVFNWTSCQWLL